MFSCSRLWLILPLVFDLLLGWSKSKTKVLLDRINRLRNNLAHARYIKSEFKKWDDIIETIEKINLLTLKIRDYLENK